MVLKKKRAVKKKSVRKTRFKSISGRAETLMKLKQLSEGETTKVESSPPKLKKVSRQVVRQKASPQVVVSEGRHGTGIAEFDHMSRGGFEKNSINLIVGGSGSGKSIFAMQFLLEGIKKREKVLYVTFEEKKEEFYKNMKKFGWDLDSAEKSGYFIFLEYSPEKVKMMLDEGGGTIETLVLRHKIKRMVIDSITSFSILFDKELEKRHSILGLFDIIRKWDCTSLLTVQYDPLDKENKGISSIEFEADSIILLYFVNIKNKRQRFIEILKMRGTSHSKEIRSFIIENGINIGGRAEGD